MGSAASRLAGRRERLIFREAAQKGRRTGISTKKIGLFISGLGEF
jgi:hypothetical protein